tara:strand:- start:96 stop:791 length:696 start_codon:yes stop_codon:yes gene_type:complete
MTPLSLLSFSHIAFTTVCFLVIIFLPRLFVNSSDSSKNLLVTAIIVLIMVNQGMDLYREGYMQEWKLGLPLHLCDFSSFSVILYFLTKRKEFFLFAFFFGIAGGGMSLLTPDILYAFPYVGYIQNQIGHSMILLGVSYAMIIDNKRPYLGDVHKVLFFTTLLLLIMYPINYLLGPPANYWFLVEKPIGDNVTNFMRAEPFHIIDIYILAVIVCYLMYMPYFLTDKFKNKNA